MGAAASAEIDCTCDAGDSDLSLMRQIALGSVSAFHQLYDRHAPWLLALSLRTLKDRDLADEVVGDVFLEVWRRADRYDATRSAPPAYLILLTRSRAIDRLREESRHVSLDAVCLKTVSDDPRLPRPLEPLDSASFGEERTRVRMALAALRPKQRTALELAFYQGMSHGEVCQAMGEPLGTIKTYIRSGVRRLRKMLTERSASRRACISIRAHESPRLHLLSPVLK